MLKKLFKAVTTLALLVGCFFGYVHVFAILVEQMRAIRRTDNSMFAVHDSKSKLESIQYARDTFGPNHWTAAEELAYRYYNAERGYWIYARECERIVEENGVRYDGKRIRLKPFAMISRSRDGKNTKTITSNVATFDLNAPLSFNLSAGGEPLKIKHAHLEPNVWVRDDKGTPRDPSDDMKIGPLTTVDYEEATQQIRTELDTYVVIQDPDMLITAFGMLIQLRKTDPLQAGASSSGFDGAERVDLLKDVHVVMRDVGNSGIMPGSVPARPAQGKAQATPGIATVPGQKAAEPDKPTPLDLRCDSKMQILLPKPLLPVDIGPPAPPEPTLIQFDRNVVLLRGQLDARPDQLTCDTLKLRMVPGEKPTAIETPAPATGPDQGPPPPAAGPAQARADRALDGAARNPVETVAQQADGRSASGTGGASTGSPQVKPEPETAGGANQGVLGGLTLQRAHATGHAVWLYLPAQGVKLRCNELIHLRQAPFKPDLTYFRGDSTRPLELEKVDIVEEDGPDKGKITSVTNIWSVDATLLGSANGSGLDTADVVAHGPGRLEVRPDRGQPVERIAIWQDKFILHNELGADGQVLHKIIDLTGNRPCFIDNLQHTMLDSAFLIKVTLKPKAPVPQVEKGAAAATALAADSGAGTIDRQPAAVATSGESMASAGTSGTSGGQRPGNSGLGGGQTQIERLHALRDVHLIAPAKTMTARQQLDAEFVEAKATQVAATAQPKEKGTTRPAAPDPSQAEAQAANPVSATQQQAPNPADGQEQVAAREEKPSTEPPMTGSCDRLWARVALTPKPAADQPAAKATASTKTAAAKAGPGETSSEIRKVWMWGNIALHQEPAQGKTRGQDATGEALYLDNRGPNRAITYIYQRDPSETTYLPGPLPPARVQNQEIDIAAADGGIIRMNQETDQAWVEGPGTLTQLTNRSSGTDKKADAATDDEGAGNPLRIDTAERTGSAGPGARTRTTSLVARTDDPDRSAPADDKAADDKAAASKPTTRAGRPLSDKVPMTIGFSQNMEFTGRSVNPEGQPAARADFHGVVTAQMEDALLHCTEKMIAFTDQEVPLAQLGAMSQSQANARPAGDAANDGGEAKPNAELTLIFCYRNAVAIHRKVDPDAPIVLEQQRIEANDILAYDRRTGDFFVPGKGKFYHYDRSDNSSQAATSNPDGKTNGNGNSDPGLTTTARTVTPTSARARGPEGEYGDPTTADAAGAAAPQGSKTTDESTAAEVPPLVLLQVFFKKGMRGQFGTGTASDDSEIGWSEFYGDIEASRAKVRDTWTTLNPDRLPSDGLFLTGQTGRVIKEPPPVGSPKSAPARCYMKAWEKAYVVSNDKVLQGDVITYDSYKDLVYAYGQQGRGVIFGEQHAAGQPASPGSARAVQLNPKTGAIHLIDSDTIQMIDKNTGVRPGAEKSSDPYAKKKKKVKKPFKLPTMNVERRGFTGQ